MAKTNNTSFLHKDKDIIEWYHSLQTLKEFEQDHIDFLNAARIYLLSMGVIPNAVDVTIVVAENPRDLFDKLVKIKACKRMLQDKPIFALYENKEWKELDTRLGSLRTTLLQSYPEYRNQPVELVMFKIEAWQKKTSFLHGTADKVVDKILNEGTIHKLMDRQPKNKFLSRNILFVGATDSMKNKIKEQCGTHKPDFYELSVSDIQRSVKFNPFAGSEITTGKIVGWAKSIATSLTGGMTHEQVIHAVAENMIGACITCLSEENKLTLATLLNVLQQPYTDLWPKLRDCQDAKKFLPDNMPEELIQKVMALLKEGATKAYTSELQSFTEPDDRIETDIWEGPRNILFLPDDKRYDTILLNNLMVEQFLQKMEDAYWDYFNGLYPIFETNNLLIVPDISKVCINRLFKYIALRNSNPFKLMVGYKDLCDFGKFNSRKEFLDSYEFIRWNSGWWE